MKHKWHLAYPGCMACSQCKRAYTVPDYKKNINKECDAKPKELEPPKLRLVVSSLDIE